MLKNKKSKITKVIFAAALMCIIAMGIDSQAAVYGVSYSFTLEANENGAPGISSGVTKQTYYNHATLYVNSYKTGSKSAYYTRAFVRGFYNSWDKLFCTTSSYKINYADNGPFNKGELEYLYMYTTPNNPCTTKVSGSWTP